MLWEVVVELVGFEIILIQIAQTALRVSLVNETSGRIDLSVHVHGQVLLFELLDVGSQIWYTWLWLFEEWMLGQRIWLILAHSIFSDKHFAAWEHIGLNWAILLHIQLVGRWRSTLCDILTWLQANSIQATISFTAKDTQLNWGVAIDLFRSRKAVIYYGMLAEVALVRLRRRSHTKLYLSHWGWLIVKSVSWFFELGHRDGASIILTAVVFDWWAVTVLTLAIHPTNMPILRAENICCAHYERRGRLSAHVTDIWHWCVM